MNNYDEIVDIIEEINIKLKEIDKQMIVVESIKPEFGNMDIYIPELESAYKEFDESLSNCIFRTQTLNKIVINDAVDSYSDIYRELNDKCKSIIDELLESVQIVNTPIEVINPSINIVNYSEIKPNELNNSIITDEFINQQVELIKPIKIGEIDPGIIPVPTPVQPDIEILDI